MNNKRFVMALLTAFMCLISAMAQQTTEKITGQIVDKDGYAIPYANQCGLQEHNREDRCLLF